MTKEDNVVPEDCSILAAEQDRENARSTPGAFRVAGPGHGAGLRLGLPLEEGTPAEGEQSREQRNADNEVVVVESATVYHDDVVLGKIRDENCAAYINGRKFNLFILILPCLAVIGACIIIPLVMLDPARRWNKEKYAKESDSHPVSRRCEDIRKVVSSVSTSKSLDDTSSPQNRALE
eukprot:8454993-Ditylum_brightwellii.AAC.1